MAFDFDRAVASQKAIPAHPALLDRDTPVSIYSPGAGRTDAKISQRNAGHHLQAYGGDEAIDHVYDCIGLYVDSASTAPFELQKKDGTKLYETKSKGTPPDAEQGPADLYELLHKPNDFMLYDEMMSLLVIDLMLVGNAYWFKFQNNAFGRPLQLFRLAPSYVKIVPGPFGPKSYEYQPPGAKDPIKMAPEDIIHFRRPNPHSAYYGMGVIQGAGRSMDLELAVTDTMASYYENKADPSLIIESERRVPRDVFNKLRAQMRARLSGSKRAGELLVLEAGLKANSLSPSASDAMFDKLSAMSRDRVYSKFRASPMLFGQADESSGSNKISDARREFDNYSIRPFLERLADVITTGLVAAWGVEFVVNYRSLLTPEDAVKVGGEIAKVPGIKIREIRRQYAQFGIEESTGDEKIDEMIINMPTPEMDANGQQIDPVTGKVVSSGGLGADRPLPGEPGRPPKGENTRAFPQGKSLDDIESFLDGLIEEQKAINTAGERVTVGNKLPDEQRPSDPFAKARQVDIDSAQNAMMAGLRDAAHQLERDLLDHVEGKALKTSDLVQRVRNSAAWKTFRERLEAVLEDGAIRAARSGVMHTGKTPDEEIDYDALAKSIVHRPEGLRGIVNTIRERIVRQIKETREADGERQDFEAAVRGAINAWSDRQVIAIADSEATEAYNEAVLTTLEASGEENVYVFDGDEDDEPCIEANGSVWTISHARNHRKEHPRCRRAFLSLASPEVA